MVPLKAHHTQLTIMTRSRTGLSQSNSGVWVSMACLSDALSLDRDWLRAICGSAPVPVASVGNCTDL